MKVHDPKAENVFSGTGRGGEGGGGTLINDDKYGKRNSRSTVLLSINPLSKNRRQDHGLLYTVWAMEEP